MGPPRIIGRAGRSDGRRRYFMVSNSLPEQTTARLFTALRDGLLEHGHDAVLALREPPNDVRSELRHLARVEWRNLTRVRGADVLVTHAPAALSIVTIVFARLMGKRVLTFVWDVYPESTTVGGTPRGRLWMTAYWLAERLGFLLSHVMVISSEDYRPQLHRWGGRLRVMPLWPCDPVRPVPEPTARGDEALRLAFAGQINAIRGLDAGVEQLLRIWAGRLELHVFSTDQCPQSLRDLATGDRRFRLIEHGYVPATQLPDHLAGLDLGWSCLDPGFPYPAFPSKVLAYISAGLPVLYTGPRLPALEELLRHHSLGLATGSMDRLAPQDVHDLRSRFGPARDRYLAEMAERWFELEAPLTLLSSARRRHSAGRAGRPHL